LNEKINNIAIISGSGSLPRLLSEALIKENKCHVIVYFSNKAPSWGSRKSFKISADFEKIGKLFDELKSHFYYSFSSNYRFWIRLSWSINLNIGFNMRLGA